MNSGYDCQTGTHKKHEWEPYQNENEKDENEKGENENENQNEN